MLVNKFNIGDKVTITHSMYGIYDNKQGIIKNMEKSISMYNYGVKFEDKEEIVYFDEEELVLSSDTTLSTEKLIMYILVNEDLEMSTGKIAGQVGHLMVNFMKSLFYTRGIRAVRQQKLYNTWINTGQTKIVLKAPQETLEHLVAQGFWHIRDNGLTEIPPNSLTCVCMGIDTKSRFYQNFPELKSLRLL